MNTSLLGFSLIALFLVMSPGVNTMLIINSASSYGPRTATLNIAGLCIGTFFHGVLSVFGISAIVISSPQLYFLVKGLGSLYLAYIGGKMLWIGATILGGRRVGKAANETVAAPKSSAASFREGLLTQLFNPKVSMFYLAAFPQFIVGGNTVVGGFTLVSIHACLIASWFLFMTFFISRVKDKLENPLVQAAINIVTGAVLLIFSTLILVR